MDRSMDLLSAQVSFPKDEPNSALVSPPLTPEPTTVPNFLNGHPRPTSSSSSASSSDISNNVTSSPSRPQINGDETATRATRATGRATVEDDDTIPRPFHRHASHPIPPPGIHESSPGPRGRDRARIRTYAEDERVKAFPRISRAVELMRTSYDAVVIGSGYGGGIAAARLARAGMSVGLLERGKERWPGEYPAGMGEAVGEVHVSGKFAPGCLEGVGVERGDPTGMYHLVFGRGQNAVVCNGLGGTSLMNANVFMEADKETLAMKEWPQEIRGRVDEMDKYYEKVEKVLEPTEYPEDWPKLSKMEVLKKQAEYLGLGKKFKKVRQTTRFHNGPNACGVEMSPSALTGQDCTGVNDGSKTTTLVTYLADAWNWGAEMFTECEVRYVEKAKNREGYIVYFAWHGRNRGHFKANLHGDLMWVHAKKAVVFGAGAIGTTEILLRSKAMGLAMSDHVGLNMSGNGDILAFGYNTTEEVNAIGRPYPSPYNPIGPTINGVIDCRSGHDNPLDGFVIEEGAVPHALAPLLQTMLDLMPGSVASPDAGLVERTQAAMARYGSRFLGPYFKRGAVERTQIYLIMSHDSNQAMLTLEDDRPVLEFLGVGRSDHVKYLNGLLARATEAVGGTLVQNPFYALMGNQEVTVHPIGGACMARDGTGQTGVTNHQGQIFTGRGKDVYDGLIVTDGAVIPTALGANPFATISALAERSVELYVKDQGLHICEEPNGILDLFGEPAHVPACHRDPGKLPPGVPHKPSRLNGHHVDPHASVVHEELDATELQSVTDASDVIVKADALRAAGFGFTEVMSGFIHYDEAMVEDTRAVYDLAFRTAKSRCESARFFLSVQAFNTGTIVHDAHHRGMLTGTFVCPTIPGSPFMVQRGEFNLFIMDTKAPGTRNLTYDFDMRGVDGKTLHFHGYKVVDSSVAFAPMQFWRSTSTLYVTVSEHRRGEACHSDPDDREAWRRMKVLAKGVMHIQPSDFLSEILTLSPTGSNIIKKLASAASFLTFFTRKSLSLFMGPLTPLQYPSQTYSGYINNTPPDRSIAIVAADGVCTRMHVWEPTHIPGDGSAAHVRNVFMVPGASVDHQIYALPTIPFNAVNFFCRAGYRVHIGVHRIGQIVVAQNNWTTYDARLDLAACLEWIREEQKVDKVYTIAHCMGSVALASGMLDGTIPAEWISGVNASQVFMNPIWNTPDMIKALLGPVPMDKLYTALAGPWFSCKTSQDDSLVQKALNQALRLVPDARRELCNSASCHRVTLAFGRCWNHANLNEATHRQVDRFFGGVNMTCQHLLMRMGSRGAVMRNAPLFEALPTKENVAKLKGVPFLLWVGRDNAVLTPASTEKTYEVLTDAFGSSGVEYKRRVVPGYGHLDGWMGRNAWKDVYPWVLEEMDRVTRGPAYKFVEPDDRFKRMVESGELLY